MWFKIKMSDMGKGGERAAVGLADSILLWSLTYFAPQIVPGLFSGRVLIGLLHTCARRVAKN